MNFTALVSTLLWLDSWKDESSADHKCFPIKEYAVYLYQQGFPNPRRDDCPVRFCNSDDNPSACHYNVSVVFDRMSHFQFLHFGCGKQLFKDKDRRLQLLTTIKAYRDKTLNDALGKVKVTVDGNYTVERPIPELNVGSFETVMVYFDQIDVLGYIEIRVESVRFLRARSCAAFDHYYFYEVDDMK